jgi:hypothetical protein
MNQLRNAAFLQALGELGWIVGRNVHIDYRWGAGDVERYRAIATDLISLAPDATSLPSHITGTRLGERLRLSGGVPYLPHGVLLDRYPE